MKCMCTLKACTTILELNHKMRLTHIMVHLNNVCVVTHSSVLKFNVVKNAFMKFGTLLCLFANTRKMYTFYN